MLRIDMGYLGKKLDILFLLLLILILAGVPIGIKAYDQRVWRDEIPSVAKDFTLTGHTQRGWLLGEVHAHDVVSLWDQKKTMKKPAIEVSKGDLVVFKLKSSDVVHGFSLKDFGVFLKEGIQPGKVTQVSFKADRVGTFTFSCNAICGENHQNMKGTLVVKA
jgi:heme/copper-type cytochrome/quinol oxidase subunit 2